MNLIQHAQHLSLLLHREQSLPGVSGHGTHGPSTWPLWPSLRPSHSWQPFLVAFGPFITSFGPGRHRGPSPAAGMGRRACPRFTP